MCLSPGCGYQPSVSLFSYSYGHGLNPSEDPDAYATGVLEGSVGTCEKGKGGIV